MESTFLSHNNNYWNTEMPLNKALNLRLLQQNCSVADSIRLTWQASLRCVCVCANFLPSAGDVFKCDLRAELRAENMVKSWWVSVTIIFERLFRVNLPRCKLLWYLSFGLRVSKVKKQKQKNFLTILNSGDESTSGDWQLKHNQTTHLPIYYQYHHQCPLVWWRLFNLGFSLGGVGSSWVTKKKKSDQSLWRKI